MEKRLKTPKGISGCAGAPPLTNGRLSDPFKSESHRRGKEEETFMSADREALPVTVASHPGLWRAGRRGPAPTSSLSWRPEAEAGRAGTGGGLFKSP